MMHTAKTRLAILIQLVLCISMQAEIPFTQIKGLYTILNKDKQYLSPVHGFNWWKLDMIQNMYRFGDQKHATIQLIRELFFLQHDGVTFDITTLKYNPASYFTPITIGKILNAIEQSPDEKSLKETLMSIMNNVAQKMEPYKNNVADALKKTEQEFNTHSAELKKQTDIHTSLTKQREKTDKTQLDNITATIERLTTLKDAARKDRESKRNILKQLEAKPNKLVDLISASLKESDGNRYAKNTLHSILLACAYKRSNEKQDFLDFFNQFTEPIVTIRDKNEWLTAQYTQNDFIALTQAIASKDYSFLDDYERASFFGYALKVWDNPLPPIISSIGNAIYAPDGIAYDFPDCGETSIRNFFNIILYDAQKKSFDLSLLPNGTSASVVSYYKTHPSADAVSTKKYYDDWTSAVSNLPSVKYSKTTANNQGYDITPGLDNLMKVFDHVLFEGNQEFATSTVDKKLDFICKVASRKDFSCEWDVLNGEKEDVLNKEKNNNITLTITITTPQSALPLELTWEFLSNHFILKRNDTTAANLALSDSLFNKIKLYPTEINLFILLGWYGTQDLIKKIHSTPLTDSFIYEESDDMPPPLIPIVIIESSFLYLYLMQQLSTNEKKITALIYNINPEYNFISDNVLISIIASLPIDEHYMDLAIGTLGEDKEYINKIMNAVLNQVSPNGKLAMLSLLLNDKHSIKIPLKTMIEIINTFPHPIRKKDALRFNLVIVNLNNVEEQHALMDETLSTMGILGPLIIITTYTEKNTLSDVETLHTILTKRIQKLAGNKHPRIKTIIKDVTELNNTLTETIALFKNNSNSILPPISLLLLAILSNSSIPQTALNYEFLENSLQSSLNPFMKEHAWKTISNDDKEILLKYLDTFIKKITPKQLKNFLHRVRSFVKDTEFQKDLEKLIPSNLTAEEKEESIK